MAQSDEHGPGHSEQGTWYTTWNGGQTEGTNHAHVSCTWALTRCELFWQGMLDPLLVQIYMDV